MSPWQCSCFELCTQSGVAHFWQKLPIVRTASSPWFQYLTLVYGSPVALPVDLAMFNLFYPQLLPSAPCHQQGDLRQHWLVPDVRRPCSSCKGWLGANNSLNISSEWSITQYVRRGSLQAVIVHGAERPSLLAHSTVEVTRLEMTFAEGLGYGCWFTPAKGSGVHVGTGRAVNYALKADVYSSCGRMQNQPFVATMCLKHGYAEPPRNSSLCGKPSHISSSWCTSSTWCPARMPDSEFASCTARRGFTSFQFLRNPPRKGARWRPDEIFRSRPPEGLLAVAGCMGNAITDACFPASVDVRSGWHANHSCSCNTSEPMLNCAGHVGRVRRIFHRSSSVQK